MTLTYSYLVSWILGGLTLLTIVFMRPARRPYWLALAMIGFGAAGFLSLGLGLAPLPRTVFYAALGALVGGTLGFAIDRIGRDPSQPAEHAPPPRGPAPS